VQAGAPGDAELLVNLAQVVVDGGRAEEQPGGDVPVGCSLRRQPGDLGLLRGEPRAVLFGALHNVLAGGGQFGAGPLGEPAGAHPLETLKGSAELVAGVAPAPLAAQPLSVDQSGAS